MTRGDSDQQSGRQVRRHWDLIRLLQVRRYGVPLLELAETCGVSERTIQRDLDVLRQVGIPVEFEEDEFGKRLWKLSADYLQSCSLGLDLTEAISLYLAERMLEPLAGTHLAEALGSLRERLRRAIPPQALDHFSQVDQVLYVRHPSKTDYSAQAETIRMLLEAVSERRVVAIFYRAAWRREEYETRIDPYGLVLYEGNLFVVARSHQANDQRLFKVTRIRRAAKLDQTFERPAEFDLDAQFRSSFGIFQGRGEPVEIEVRFTGPAVDYVGERIWHESQRLERCAGSEGLFEELHERDGELLARFRLAELTEFKSWIKGLGALAEVLRPDWLRREMREELASAARLYEEPTSTANA